MEGGSSDESSAARFMIVIAHDTTVARLLEKHIADLGEASPDLVNPKNGPKVNASASTPTPLEKAEAGEEGGAPPTQLAPARSWQPWERPESPASRCAA